MTNTLARARVFEALSHLDKWKSTGKRQWQACCPAHSDRNPSLSIGENEEGTALLTCHAGCPVDDILAALGCTHSDLFAQRERHATTGERGRHIVRVYDYRAADGTLLYQVVRYDPKDFSQRRPDGKGGWIWKLDDIARVPYRLPELTRADPAAPVYVVEGEKDADRLAALGLIATTTAQGAKNWKHTAQAMTEALRHRHIVILPDADDAGDGYASDACKTLDTCAASVRVVRLPGLEHRRNQGEDVSAWLDNHGGTIEQLKKLTAASHEVHASQSSTANEYEITEFDEIPPRDLYPTPLAPEAFYGLAGDIVKAIDPHTEADPAAILLQLLVAVGNAAGRHAYFQVEADRHYAVLNAILTGNTAKGRKGTSWGHVHSLLEAVDPEWAAEHIAGGLSSGEGLIHRLRDRDPDEPKGQTDEQRASLKDKRLLVLEGEFASVLKVFTRDGNTLSAILRQAWDGRPLCVLTKQSPERASDTHVSIIGHITKDELVRHMTATETANGLGNRFLWVCVKRSKLLPEGGDIEALNRALAPLKSRLRAALDFAKGDRQVTRDGPARVLWNQQYERLSSGHPGMFGAATARAEAQVLRLSCLYALLDCSPVVRVEHLRAALAVWRYAEDSARYIFGDALGDAIADTILQALLSSSDGMPRADLYALFGRNIKADKLTPALKKLLDAHLARCEKVDTEGRPAERWYAVTPNESNELYERRSADDNSSNSLLSSADVPPPARACMVCQQRCWRWDGHQWTAGCLAKAS